MRQSRASRSKTCQDEEAEEECFILTSFILLNLWHFHSYVETSDCCESNTEYDTELNDDPGSSILTCGQLSPTAVVCFLYRNYCHKSIATQIPCDVGLEMIPYTGRKFLPLLESNQCRILYCEIKPVLNSVTSKLVPFSMFGGLW